MSALSRVGSIVIVCTMSAMIRISQAEQDRPPDVAASPLVHGLPRPGPQRAGRANEGDDRPDGEHGHAGDLEAVDDQPHQLLVAHPRRPPWPAAAQPGPDTTASECGHLSSHDCGGGSCTTAWIDVATPRRQAGTRRDVRPLRPGPDGTFGRLTPPPGSGDACRVNPFPLGVSVSRRSFLAPLAALVAILAIVLAACSSSASQAPALTDPKEILTKTATSLADVKTVEMTGSFNGSVKADQLGNIDLSTMTLSAAMDVPNKKAKVSLDAPTLMGTKLDAPAHRPDGLLQGRRPARDDAQRLGRQVDQGPRAERLDQPGR